MSTAYVSGRVPARYERLVTKQARAARMSKSDLVARHVIEKSLETEFPGISFRDSLSGREAYLTGHRVAVWEVMDVYREEKTIARTAEYFSWTPALVRCALAYAKAFPAEITQQREVDLDAAPDWDVSVQDSHECLTAGNRQELRWKASFDRHSFDKKDRRDAKDRR